MDPYSGRTKNIGHFSIFLFFIFFEISAVQPFFRQKFFLTKILDTKNVSKNHEKFFGEQHNIKELSHKKFLDVHTIGTKKFNFFDFWGFVLGK